MRVDISVGVGLPVSIAVLGWRVGKADCFVGRKLGGLVVGKEDGGFVFKMYTVGEGVGNRDGVSVAGRDGATDDGAEFGSKLGGLV